MCRHWRDCAHGRRRIFLIALVDAWSEVLDILTFYTERLANEAYLGTAIEAAQRV